MIALLRTFPMAMQSFETNMNTIIVYFTIDSSLEVIIIPEEPQIQPANWSELPNILLLAGLVVAAGSVAFTFGTESRWIGHTVTSIIGMILMIVVILTGAVPKAVSGPSVSLRSSGPIRSPVFGSVSS